MKPAGFNEYIIDGDSAYIILKQHDGSTMNTIIDAEDLCKLIEDGTPWHAQWCKRTQSYYATGCKRFVGPSGKRIGSTISLNRVVLNITDRNIFVDHINHDTLDNRKANLRTSSCSQNCRHRKGPNKNNTSGYRNVIWNKNTGKWMVIMQKDWEKINGGEYDDVDEAGRVAFEMRKKYFGEFSGLDTLCFE